MGLDTTHGCWHGAYSAFTRWRDTPAKLAGYGFTKMDTGHGFIRDVPDIDLDSITEANCYGAWDKTPADPLLVLIVHSDCGGVIHPEQAGPLANRLAELLPQLPSEDDAGHIGNWRAKTQAFIDGLRDAAHRGELVGFH